MDQMNLMVLQWRYLLFLGVFGLELYLIVAPWPIPSTGGGDRFVDAVRPEWGVLEGLFPQRVAYQHILLLHEVFLFVSVAVSRVAPVLFGGVDGETEGRVVGAMGARIGELSKTLEREGEWVFGCGPPLTGCSVDDARRGGACGRRCWAATGDGAAGDGGDGGGEYAEEGGADGECMGRRGAAGSCTVSVFVSWLY